MPLPTGARAAISLTYDDALPVHRELVAPELERRRLRATFYAPAAAADLHAHRDGWARMAAAGHELGNHTCFHPCRGGPDSAWLDPAYDMRGYNERRFVDELVLANAVLASIDGRATRSFAATCGNLTVGDGAGERSIAEAALRHTACIRSGVSAAAQPLTAPPTVLTALWADRATAATVIAAVDAAIAQGGWLIVLMHGVGPGTHHLAIALDEHRRLIDHLADLGDVAWTAPVIDVWEAAQPAEA
jgi:peptidoglycan/xylan/chitin deacetylase (PgdA/CDA1 family)